MPARWFSCPDGAKIEIADCLSEGGCRVGSRCAPPAYLKIVAYQRPWTGTPSTTQLISGTMLAYLKLTHEYSICPDDRAFAVHGTKVHQNLQAADVDFSDTEGRLDGDVTGIFDALIQENGRNTLLDYKTSGSYKVARALGFHVVEKPTGEVYKSGKRKGEPRKVKTLTRADDMIDRWEWELQLNKYRLEIEKRGRRVHDIRLACVVRDGNTWMARSRGVLRNLYYFPIRRLADDIVIRYFEHKRQALFTALERGWEKPCSPKENWGGIRCKGYCEVAEFCVLGKFLRKEKETIDMPIKGLSDVTRLPRIGKIRLGVKVTNDSGKEYPKEVEYFILDPETPNEADRERLLNDFHVRYGEKPTAIKVMLPLGDSDVVFPQWYKRYGSTTLLKCKGDGETANCGSKEFAEGLEILNEENGGIAVRCDGKECRYFEAKQCAAVGTLNVLLYEMEGAGVWQISTGSINSIINLNSGMQFLQAAAGRFHMLPLILERRPQEMQRDGGKATHYPLHLNVEKSLAEMQAFAQIDAEKVFLELPVADEEAVDLALEHEIPVEPDAPPIDVNEGGFDLVVLELADVLGIDRVTFGQFSDAEFVEKDIGILRAALKEEGHARNEVQKKFTTWLDKQVDANYAGERTDAELKAEAARLEAELGKDAPEDYVGEEAEAQPDDVPFVDGKVQKIKLIQDMLPKTPMESTRTNGYKSWGLKLLGKRAFPLLDLPEADLDTLIADLNTQMDVPDGQGELC